MTKAEHPDIARARELILTHGWNSTSFQIINPGIKRWFSGANDSVVGYVSKNRRRIVVGAPVCERSRLGAVVDEFEADASRMGELVCYFAAEARLDALMADAPGHSKFLIGAQSVWHPAKWDSIVSVHRSLRAQLNRAKNKGVTVAEWQIDDAAAHPKLQRCLDAWLDSKGLPPLRFMVETDTLARLEGRRVFVAEANGSVVGFVVLSPIATRNGWLYEQFPHTPKTPNGTVELMIDTAMRSMADGGYEYATLGLSPLSTRSDVPKFDNPAWLRLFLFWLRKHGQRFYNFDGLDAFKAKLRPENWEPIFAVSNEKELSFRTIYAIASAFSGGSPIRLFSGGIAKATTTELKWLKRRISG